MKKIFIILAILISSLNITAQELPFKIGKPVIFDNVPASDVESTHAVVIDSLGNVKKKPLSEIVSPTPNLHQVLTAGSTSSVNSFGIYGNYGNISIGSGGVQLDVAGATEGAKQVNIFGPNGANYIANSSGISMQGGQGAVVISGNNGGITLNGQGGSGQGTNVDQGDLNIRGGNSIKLFDGTNTESGLIRPIGGGMQLVAKDPNGVQRPFLSANPSYFRLDGNGAPLLLQNSFNNAMISMEGTYGQIAIGTTSAGLSDGINLNGRSGGIFLNGNSGGVFINGQGSSDQGTTINGPLKLSPNNGITNYRLDENKPAGDYVLATLDDIPTDPYLSYVVTILQSSTGAPTVTVLENELGGSIAWSYSSTGTYIGTLTGAFPAGKVVPFIGGSTNCDTSHIDATRVTNDTFSITTYCSGAVGNGILNGSTTLEIRIYP